MKVRIAAIGRMKAGPERELMQRYLERAQASGRALGLSGFDMSEAAEARGPNAEARKSEEAKFLLAQSEGGLLVALDERGKAWDSEKFANWVGARKDEGAGQMSFVIGGPDGLDESVRNKADLVLSFSPLTWPHQMVRFMLTEQIYRAITILSGHPYHRGE